MCSTMVAASFWMRSASSVPRTGCTCERCSPPSYLQSIHEAGAEAVPIGWATQMGASAEAHVAVRCCSVSLEECEMIGWMFTRRSTRHICGDQTAWIMVL